MQVPMAFLAPSILAALLLTSQASASVSKCNATITGSMISSLHPNGRPTNMIECLKGRGMYSFMFLSSCDETKKGPVCLAFEVESDHVGVMSFTLPDTTTISKQFPIAEGNGGEYIVQTNDEHEYQLHGLYMDEEKRVMCSYRCCEKCTGTKADVGCAVALSHKDEPATKAALKKGLEVLEKMQLADNLVYLQHCAQ